MTTQQEQLFVLFAKHLVSGGWQAHTTSEIEALAAGVIVECWEDYEGLSDTAALTLLLKHVRLAYKGTDVLANYHRQRKQNILGVLLEAHYRQALKIAAKIWAKA